MELIDILGYVGSLLIVVKIGIHIYIKRKVDKKFDIGPSGRFLNPALLFPIGDDVTGRLRLLKKIANIIYIIGIALFLIYVIAINMNRPKT